MAIITATEYQTYAGLTVATDGRLTTLIASVQGSLERYLGRFFEYNADFEEFLDGEEADVLQLSRYPVYSVSSVALVTPDETVLTTYEGFKLEATTGLIRLYGQTDGFVVDESAGLPSPIRGGMLNVFPRGFRNIRVSYAGGYGTPNTAMPDDVKQVMFDLLDWRLARRGGDPALTGERLGQYGYDRSADAASTNFNVYLEQVAAPLMKGGRG